MDIIDGINKWGKEGIFEYGIIETIVIMLMYLIVAYLIARFAKMIINRKVSVNTNVINRLVKITIYTIAAYGCLSLLKPFDSVLSKLWGSAGVIALVVGFAAQEAMGNFVNGILITTFKPFKVGDLVIVNQGEYEGYVVDISLRDTVIRTYTNSLVVIPNSIMNKAVLENVNQEESFNVNFLYLEISYESDIDIAKQIIENEVMNHPNYLDMRSDEEKEYVDAVVTQVVDFADSGIKLRTKVYSKTKAQGFDALCDLRISIKKRFDEEGIEIPYPHRTIINK